MANNLPTPDTPTASDESQSETRVSPSKDPQAVHASPPVTPQRARHFLSPLAITLVAAVAVGAVAWVTLMPSTRDATPAGPPADLIMERARVILAELQAGKTYEQLASDAGGSHLWQSFFVRENQDPTPIKSFKVLRYEEPYVFAEIESEKPSYSGLYRLPFAGRVYDPRKEKLDPSKHKVMRYKLEGIFLKARQALAPGERLPPPETPPLPEHLR